MRILALHGMTLSGATMRRQMGRLRPRLEQLAEVRWLDAPHVCPAQSVERHYGAWRLPVPDGPHLRWWNAVNGGARYEGWDETHAMLSEHAAEGPPPVLLGFSQGAMVATAVALSAAQGRFPPLAGVALIAGAPPRASHVVGEEPPAIQLPSLHVWGEADDVTGAASARLVNWYAPEQRQVLTWPGSHSIPRRGPPAEAILDFLRGLSSPAQPSAPASNVPQ